MSMQAILSALRGAGRRQVSASTIGVRQATGSHVIRIDRYTHVTKTVANGLKMTSGMFNVGGHDWRLLCYPNGCSDEYKGHVSIFLQHASHANTGDATAKGQLSILDQAGVPSCTKPITECTFKRTSPFAWGERDFVKHQDLDREKHLKGDCLTVLCDVTVTEYHIDHTGSSAAGPGKGEASQGRPPHRPDQHAEVVASAAPPFDLGGQLGEAMWNIKKVDVEIQVGGETFPAHRWVLEAQSPVFKTELSIASTATGTTRLHVDGMDAQMFKDLLRFMYTSSPPATSQLEEVTTAEKLLVAAERYKLEKLKQICEEALCRHIGTNTVAATLAFAERHHCCVLEAACVKFLRSPGNLEAFLAAGGLEQIRTAGYPIALRQLY